MAEKQPKLQLVGGGKMGQALLAGLIRTEWARPDELVIVEIGEQRRAELAKLFPGTVLVDSPIGGVDTIVAVKPHSVASVCGQLENCGRVISVAAGIRIAAISDAVEAGTTVIRVMPNTPALIGKGVSAVAASPGISEDDVTWATTIMAAVGSVAVVTEDELDAVTGLSGSGPAYVFAFAEAFAAAGVKAGLSADVAETLAFQTLYGSACLLDESELGPAALREQVTTPGGTTAAGLGVLGETLPDLLADTVAAAAERSIELGAQ